MLSVTNDFKTALTQPRQIDAKVVVNNSTTLDSTQLNSIQREFNTDLFKTIVKKVEIDSNVSMNKGDTIVPSMGLLVNGAFEYLSLGTFKVKDAPELNKDTNSYQISTYDKIVECMVSYDLTSSNITYPCTVRQLFVAIFTKLGWSTSGIPSTFVNSTSQIEEDVYSNMNMTYRDVLDELCTISCMFLADKNGVPTLYQKTTTSETINEEFMKDANVVVKNRVFFNSLVFSRASESDNIYRKDDTSIANNGLHEFKVSNLQILSLNWRDNFIDAMWNYIKTFEYYAFEIDTIGIGYLEPVDAFNLSTFNTTYSTLLLNDDLTIRDGISERIYADEPKENETDYRYASDTDKKINQTNLIVDKQNGKIEAVVSEVNTIENDLSNPTITLSGTSFDIEDALDQPLQDFKMYGDTQQDSTPTPSSPQPIHNVSGDNTIEICGKNLLDNSKIVKGRIDNGVVGYESDVSVLTTTDNSIAFTTTANWRGVSSNYIEIKNGTFVLIRGTSNTTLNITIYFYDKDKNYISYNGTATQSYGWRAHNNVNNAKYIRLAFLLSTAGSCEISNAMVDFGTEPSSYEPYKGQSQLISLGVENILQPLHESGYTITTNGITYTYNEDGSVRVNGTATANSSLVIAKQTQSGLREALLSGNYFLSGTPSGASSSTYRLQIYGYNASGGGFLYAYDSGLKVDTFVNENANFNIGIWVASGQIIDLVFKPQLEKGSKANSFSPYGTTPIELNKIGNYQDYIYKTDKWYWHKATNKIKLSSSWTWYISGNVHIQSTRSGDAKIDLKQSGVGVCNYFEVKSTGSGVYFYPILQSGVDYLRIQNGTTIWETIDDFKAFLDENEVYFCYPLGTPQEIEITDTTLLEQLNNLMTIPLIKDLTQIIITPNDLTPTLDIEYLRNTSINENFVRQPQLESYYTKVETDAQIEISSNQIQSTVSELQTQVDSNGNAISSVSNQVQNLQTSTSTQINTINQTLENGVSKLTNSLVTIDINGINTSKADETFNTQITNKTFEVRDGETPLVFVGYDTDEQRTVARIDTLESKRATIGVHRTEVITRNGVKRTAGFYVGGGN